jgi:hypothetical protein
MEIEFKSAAGLAEAQTDHNLRLRGEGTTWFVESTTRIQAKSLVEATDHVDVQLPRRRAAGGFLELASVAPALAFPALMPWPGLAPADARLSWAAPIEIRWEEEGTEMPAADGTRRVRLRWSRQNPKQTTLTLHGKYAVPPGARQVRLDLPRPLGVLDRGGSVNVACGPLVELLAPGLDGPEAVPERQHWQRQADLAPTTVDVAWRPYQPVSPVNAVVDVTIFERSAQVRQHLYFMTPDKSAGSMRLRAPPPIEQVTVEGGKILGDAKPKNELLWVAPSADASGKCDLLLEYDVPLTPPAPADEAAAPAVWNLPLIWPDAIAFARRDAKVRVWLPPGTFSALAPGADDWHERGIESVPERDGLPGLVVRGAGGHLPLTAPVRLSHQAPLAPLVCDRVLIHARVADDGTHFYRARFLVRKVAGGKLTLELPVPVHGPDGNNLQAVRFGADKLEKNLSWHEAGNSSAVVNLPTDMPNVQSQSFLLEVEYRAPGVAGDGRRLLRSVLQPPHWQGEALTGAVRWRVEVPADHVGLLVGSGVSLDYRWMFHGWLLTPQTSVTDADLESWLTGREGGETTPVDIAFSRAGLAQQRIVLLPRQWWLLACSGLVLALGLTFYLVTLRRPVRWILLVLALAGAAAAAWQWPAAAPLVVYGCQPGLLVLLTLLSVQWVWQERYRRQVVVMPGFARRQSGSTLSHPRQPAKPREPSTVDSPPGSAVNTSTPSTL